MAGLVGLTFSQENIKVAGVQSIGQKGDCEYLTNLKIIDNGNHLNHIYFITSPQASDEEIETAIDAALEAGYRHIDTAPVYGNEQAIGRVLKRWLDAGKVKREELFIVTKVPPVCE